MLMHVVFHDINNETFTERVKGSIPGLNFTEILYADDTLLITSNARAAGKLLRAVESESLYYNLKLNKSKCSMISMIRDSRIAFADGTQLANVPETKYLGGLLTKRLSPKARYINEYRM